MVDGADGALRCPTCGRGWPASHATCPDDGAVLATRSGATDAASGLPAPAVDAVADDRTGKQDLHTLDTVLLATGRALWDERPTADDETRIDQRPAEGETALHIREISVAESPSSREITAESPRAVESTPPPEPASNPEPTVATKLDPVITHLVPGTLVGEFVIDRLLGAGAMGEVYGGHHEQLGKRIAIKVIAASLSRDRGAIERFAQESAALARIAHPHIVGVLGVGTLPGDGRSYFAMEWIDGETLQARIDRARLPLDLSLDVLDQIARGLAAAHAAGIVHRDLKPDNLFLQRVGDEPVPVVRVVDFGLAKLSAHRRSEETAVDVMFGTPQYMSPEQCRSARDVGPATDVYALGVVAYELLCGRLPFLHDNSAELIAAHQTEPPPRPRDLAPDLDQRLDDLIYAMVAKDPSRRPTLAVVRSTIASARQGRTSRTSATVTAPRPAASPRRRRGLVIAIAGLALLSFVIASSLLGSRVDRQEARSSTPRIDAGVSTSESRPSNASAVPPPAGPVDVNNVAPLPVPPVERVAVPVRDAGHDRSGAAHDVTSNTRPVVVTATDARQPERPAEPTGTEQPRGPDPTPALPAVEREPPRVPAQRSTPHPRDPKDRTFDPFHRSPR